MVVIEEGGTERRVPKIHARITGTNTGRDGWTQKGEEESYEGVGRKVTGTIIFITASPTVVGIARYRSSSPA